MTDNITTKQWRIQDFSEGVLKVRPDTKSGGGGGGGGGGDAVQPVRFSSFIVAFRCFAANYNTKV